jgi:hypothetical protein
MKTEWMYFMAGAGLMAAVMSFNMNESSSVDCVAVADFYAEGKGTLTTPEWDVYLHLLKMNDGQNKPPTSWPASYASGYKACMAFEGK